LCVNAVKIVVGAAAIAGSTGVDASSGVDAGAGAGAGAAISASSADIVFCLFTYDEVWLLNSRQVANGVSHRGQTRKWPSAVWCAERAAAVLKVSFLHVTHIKVFVLEGLVIPLVNRNDRTECDFPKFTYAGYVTKSGGVEKRKR
jgi:hypothetical protein